MSDYTVPEIVSQLVAAALPVMTDTTGASPEVVAALAVAAVVMLDFAARTAGDVDRSTVVRHLRSALEVWEQARRNR